MMNFEGAYISGTAGGFRSNLELEVPHPEEICTEKFVGFCSVSVELKTREKWRSLHYCKIHTCLSYTPDFFSRMIHYHQAYIIFI